MNGDDFTYDKGYRSSDSGTVAIKRPNEEIIEAMESVVDRTGQFQEIMFRNDELVIIKTSQYSKLMKRVLRVSFVRLEDDAGALVMCSTMVNQTNPMPSGLSRKLLIETLKELGMEEEAKEFSKKSNKNELKSLGKGAVGGVVSIVKMVIGIIIILIIIGVIRMIFS